MKKTIKILSIGVLFFGIMLLHSYVSAATNGIVLPIEKATDLVRTDKGNTTTLELKEEYYQEESKLSQKFQDAIKQDPQGFSTAGAYYYIPVPKDFGTKYKYAKTYLNGDKTHLFELGYTDENFNLIKGTTGDPLSDYVNAKYFAGVIQITQTFFDSASNTSTSRLVGGKANFGIIYYDENNNPSEPVEYTIVIKPKLSIKQFAIQISDDGFKNSKGYVFNGEYDKEPYQQSFIKGKQIDIRTLSENRFIDSEEILTSQTKFTVEDENILTISKDGKLTAKNPGFTTIKVETQGISTTIKVNVYIQTYFEDKITKDQINDLIAYAKQPNSGDEIYYSTRKDTALPVELVKAAKELKKTLSVSVIKDDFDCTWRFKPEDITDTNMSINLDVSKVDCFVDELKDKKDVIFLDFKHSGKLPGKANISLYSYEESEKPEGKVYLYYYNEETKKCEFIEEAKRNEWTEIVFTLDHCSRYVISDTELTGSIVETAVEANKGQLDDEPKTGEEMTILTISYMLIAISVAGILYKVKQ